ncbi:MAG: ribonuclease P protein component [Spirochaetia bacterium]
MEDISCPSQMRESLSKREILSHRDLQKIFKGGTRYRSGGIGCFFCRGEHKFSRMGISISKKYGNAVCRNYAKRVIRELFRRHRTLLKTPVDFVVVVYPHHLSYAQAESVIIDLFSRI